MAQGTAERVSLEVSDNFVYQRSRLAYVEAAKLVSGRVLEIGTGTGYGVDIIAPNAAEFVTLDKFRSERVDSLPANVRFVEAAVPPLPFEDESFDFVVSFQVIEHIKRDKRFVQEVMTVQINTLLKVGRGVTALIGGGGKTTLMLTLAKELCKTFV